MPTASLDDIQSVPAGPGTASLSDIQSVQPPAPQGGTASLYDIASVAPPVKTASLSDIAEVHGPLIPSNATISAAQPSVWDRISNIFTSGIPQFSSRTSSNPKYGQMQLVSPEEALTPGEQQRHPVVTATGEVAGGFTSPESAALIAGTGGLGEIGGAAGKIVPRLVSGGFALQQLLSAANQVPEIKDALRAGDYNRAEYLLTKVGLQTGIAALGAKHAATGKGAVSGKAGDADLAEVHPIPADEPAAQILQEHAPGVRLTDTTATAEHLKAQDTLSEPRVTVRVPDDAAKLEAAKSGDSTAEPETKTVPTARIVSDDHLPVASKTEIVNEAVQRVFDNSRELQKLGLDPEKIESGADVGAMLNSVAGKIKANLDPRVGSTITFDAQKALASDLNLNVEDLLGRNSGTAVNAETAVAARALLKDSQTNVMNLARLAATGDEHYQTKFAESLAQHQAITESVKGMAAEAGRALGSFRIAEADLPQKKITDLFSKLDPAALTKAAQLLSKIDPNDVPQVNNFIEQLKPSSTADKVFEYYRNALLSSPKTVTVKAASEIGMMALEAAKKVVVGGLSPDRFASEGWFYAKGALAAMSHAKDVLTGKFDLADAPGFEGGGTQAIKGAIGDVVRFPGKVLEKQTNLMYVLNYFGELHSQAARAAIHEGLDGEQLHARQEYLAANPTPDMSNAAHMTALHNTFQNSLGKFGKGVQKTIQNDPTGLAKFLFPFVKTPINLVKASAEVSPYGLLKGLAKGDVDLTARGLIGSSIATGIAALALEGHITGGGPIDFKKQKTLEATGWQPYSIKIGNRYISFHRMEPLGLVMGLVADAVHGTKLGDSSEVASSKADNALTHIERNLQSLPFMYGLSSIVDALKDTSGKRIDNFIARQAAGFIPAGVANIAEGIDPTVRHPVGMQETLESRIPGLTNRVQPSLDIAGKPLQRPASQLGGANPFPVTTATNDPVLTELARLGVSTPIPPKTVHQGKTQIELSENERTQLASQEGQLLYRRVSDALKTDWAKLTDAQKDISIKKWRVQIDHGRANRLFKLRTGR
jgi:hypothetical protein